MFGSQKQRMLTRMLTPDIKELIAIAAGLLIIGNHLNYLRAIFAGQAQPHFYSWLIWTITQGTAATAVILGGGGATGWALFVAASLVATVALVSLRYGTKNIKKHDSFMLVTALLAIVLWWLLDNALIAVLLVTVVDIIGYTLTLLKINREHMSETLTYWSLDLLTYVLLVLALSEYSFQTAIYPIAMCIMSVLTVCLLYYRRLS